MKAQLIYNKKQVLRALLAGSILFCSVGAVAQDSTVPAEEKPVEEKRAPKPVKNTFESIWLIDNQTVMVPAKRTFEMDILHRFGTVQKGYKDFFGFFAPSNIRLGFNYTPINNTMVGVSITKANMTWEAYGKYAIIKQTKGIYPVSVSYFADMAIDSREKENFRYFSDRLSYFHQLLIARKFSDKFSAQVAPSVSYVNVVEGYYKSPGVVKGQMKHAHIAVAASGRFKLKEAMAVIANYDQPITKHPTNNPKPNISLGLELSTSAHSFQIFAGNYYFITPQRNNFFNKNQYEEGQFLIGFNITRLWSY